MNIKQKKLRIYFFIAFGFVLLLSFIPYGLILFPKEIIQFDSLEVLFKGHKTLYPEVKFIDAEAGRKFEYLYQNFGNLNGIPAFNLLIFQCVLFVLFIFFLMFSYLFQVHKLLFRLTYKRWILITLPILFFSITYTLGYIFFNHTPIIQDSVAQILQAKLFLDGKVTTLIPHHKEFFVDAFIAENNNRWFGMYPPAHSFFLMLGYIFNSPEIINPLFGSLTIIGVYFLAKTYFGKKVAFLSLVLAFISPMLIAMSTEFMNHATSLLFATIFYISFYKLLKTKRTLWALLTAVSIAIVFLTRPYTAFALGLPYAIYLSYLTIKNKFPKKQYAICCLLFFSLASLQLIYNYKTTGNPMVYGYIKMLGAGQYPGFGKSAESNEHNLNQAIRNTSNDLIGLNYFTAGFAIPCLLFIVPAIFILRKKEKMFLLISPIISQLFFNMFFYGQHYIFGPRFMHESLSLLLVIISYGIISLSHLLPKMGFKYKPNHQRLLVLYLIAFSIIIQIAHYKATIEKSIKENKGFKLLPTRLKEKNLENALVFINSPSFRMASQLPFNDNANVIYARDFRDDNKNQKLINYYNNRKVFYERNGQLFEK